MPMTGTRHFWVRCSNKLGSICIKKVLMSKSNVCVETLILAYLMVMSLTLELV